MEQGREIVTEEPEAAPVESPPQDDLDSLLAEYDSKVRPSELPADNSALGEVGQDAPTQGSTEELDKLLAEISGPSADTQRADALQGQLSELQAQVRREQDWWEFESYSDDLQKQLGLCDACPKQARFPYCGRQTLVAAARNFRRYGAKGLPPAMRREI